MLLGSDATSEQLAPSDSLLDCSVGIMAYNEEANIANAIEAILSHPLDSGSVGELIVVASGCTDRTTDIVEAIAAKEPRVRLIVQERRMGKASAINLFVGAARSHIVLMVSADVLVKEGTVDALLRPFADPVVGMVGGRPIPVNDESTFLGYSAHLLWRLHDRLARLAPKLGEIVAFRNVVPSIPPDTAVDEISIQALISQMGYRLVYEPEAIVYNHGPTSVGDFLKQRRRIFAGHLQINSQQGYEAPTMSVKRIGRVLVGSGSFAGLRSAIWTLGTIGLEATARALGYYDFVRHRQHHVWQTAMTTKQHIAGAAEAQTQQSVLVFNLMNFHRLQLELGLRASRQLAQRVASYIQHSAGPLASISVQRSETIVVVLPGGREEAELKARQLLDGLEESGISAKVACGIIAFSQTGQALAESISASAPKAVHAVGA